MRILILLLIPLISFSQEIPRNAWLCEYLDAKGNVISKRVEQKIIHDFNAVIKEGVQKEGLGARWTGDFQFNDSTYKFTFKSDRSIKVNIDGEDVVKDLGNRQMKTYTASKQLNGVKRLIVEYNLNHDMIVDSENPVTVNDIIITVSNYEKRSDNISLPKNLMDGDLSTSSRWSVLGTGEWAIFKLPEIKLIESIDISWAYSRTNLFDLLVSKDSTNWHTIYNKEQSSLEKEKFINFDFVDIPAQYVKLVVHGYGNPERQWNSVTEVKINSVDVPVEPPPIEPPSKDTVYIRQLIKVILRPSAYTQDTILNELDTIR